MQLSYKSSCLAVVTAICLTSINATAAVFSGLYSFGDSLSDSGNTNLATSGALPGAGYDNGHYSNGRIWVEYVARNFGMTAPTPSLLGGTNSSWAGAYTLTGGSVPTITQQVGMFTGGGGSFLPTDLITLWGGANDFLLGGQTNPLIPAANIANLIPLLANAGAKTIVLPNLPDLGDTPALLSTGDPASIVGASMWTQAFNANLFSQIPTLETTYGIDIIPIDIYGFAKQLKTNPALYGFTNTKDGALLTGNAANAAQYLYWDSVHPTTAVHEMFAGLVPEPSGAVLVLMFAAGASLRRHRRAA
jgi:outer membrane lipase/esterase